MPRNGGGEPLGAPPAHAVLREIPVTAQLRPEMARFGRVMSGDEFVQVWPSTPDAVTHQQTRQTESFRRQRVMTLG
jgi:hypothetical protein